MLVLVAVLVSGAAAGQPSSVEPGAVLAWCEEHVLEAEFVNHRTRVDGPRMPPSGALRAAASVFEITIEGEIPEATAAIHAAADIWTSYVTSDVPIEVTVVWTTMGENILGSSAPRLAANFTAALERDIFFPTALANALEARNLFPDHADVTINLNAAFDHWYFGIDGQPPDDTFDLVSVVLHEIGHGLGFIGTMRVTGGTGECGTSAAPGYPMIYDFYTETDHPVFGTRLLDGTRCPGSPAFLAEALQSEALYFNSPTAVIANLDSQLAQGLPVPAGDRPKLHAPPEWVPGSSYSHLTEERDTDDNEIFYPPGSLNSLMTPRLGATEVIRTPGPVACGMLRDMGWPLGASCLALLELPTVEEPLVVGAPWPNPAMGGRLRVPLAVDEPQRVTATLYDVVGRRVMTVFDGNPLTSFIEIDAPWLASGVYILVVRTRDATQSIRLTNVARR